jgi:hypothetical protein
MHADPAKALRVPPTSGVKLQEQPMANELPHERRVRLFDGVNALLGLWLIVSPYIVGAPGRNVATSGIVVGVLVVILAIMRVAYKRTIVAGLAMAALGAWTIMSPWVLRESTEDFRTWNYILAGVLIAALEAYSLTSSTTQPNWRQSQTGRR